MSKVSRGRKAQRKKNKKKRPADIAMPPIDRAVSHFRHLRTGKEAKRSDGGYGYDEIADAQDAAKLCRLSTDKATAHQIIQLAAA